MLHYIARDPTAGSWGQDPMMWRRRSVCLFPKIAVMVTTSLFLCALYQGHNGAIDSVRWIYHSLNVLSFSHTIIIMNSLPSTPDHPNTPPYPHPYKFLIKQPDKCQRRNPFLVLLVPVESHDVISRNVIRETWGDVSNYKEVDILRLFLVGQSPVMTSALQRLLEEESAMYGDIIQQDFMDTYNNLTLKTLMGMEWVTKFCPKASYVMKVDTDVFLNVNYLVHRLLHPDLPARQNFWTGLVYFYAEPVRNKMHKWYLPEELFPGDTFPPYPSGPGYVFSGDIARKIYHVAQGIRVIKLEDVFIGMCLYRLKIPPTRSPRNLFNREKYDFFPSALCNVVIVHHHEKDDLRNVWSTFKDKKTCIC